MPDVRETFCFIYFFADNFTGSKDRYKTDVSFLCQYMFSNGILRFLSEIEIDITTGGH